MKPKELHGVPVSDGESVRGIKAHRDDGAVA
jgi:hypothetical protein